LDKIPKISVITPCYNHGKFINEMIESVSAQTFEDYEIIIVNDGSTDNTADILNYIDNEKIKVIHTENHGPAIARNTAIRYARASVIMNLDADDKIAPDLLEKAYEVFEKISNAGIVYCDAECFGAKSGKFEIGEYTKEAMLFDNRINSLSFFRKDDWQKVGGYSDELIYGLEDWDFWLLIIELGREVIKIPGAHVYYRTYEKLAESRSGRRKTDRMKMNRSKITIFKRHEKLYSEYPGAWSHFSCIERKFKNENFLGRFLRDCKYNFMKRYYYR
jgi:glycosyltransferase involved in cell wall biosynthesis